MKISEKIFELLKQQGKSQKSLANYVGIKATAISEWKAKGTNPLSKYIPKIAEFLEVSPSYLLGCNEANEESFIPTVQKTVSNQQILNDLVNDLKMLPEEQLKSAKIILEQFVDAYSKGNQK